MSLAPHACFGSRTFGKMTNGMKPYGFGIRSATSSPRHSSNTSGVQCSVIVVVAVLPSVAGTTYCEATAVIRDGSSGRRQA